MTGLRIPSSWWRCNLNEEFVPFHMGGGSNHLSYTYYLNTCRSEWGYDTWQPQDRGEDDYQLKAVLDRMNLELSHEGIDYISLPNRTRSTGFGFMFETLATGRLARNGGWSLHLHKLDNILVKKRWGWGLNIVIRDWQNDWMKKVCISAPKAALLESTYILEGLQLFRGSETQPISGSGRDYIYRPSVTDTASAVGNGTAGHPTQDPGSSAGGPTKGEEVKQSGEGGLVDTLSGKRDVSELGGRGVVAEPALHLNENIPGKSLEPGRTGTGVVTTRLTKQELGASTREAVGGLL